MYRGYSRMLMMMGPQRLLCAFLFLVLVLRDGDATEPDVQTHDDEDGSCRYELRIPKVSCQQCKCQLDDAGGVIGELRGRLASIERQVQQIISMVPPDYEVPEYPPTSSLSSIMEFDPFASPVLIDEGASVPESVLFGSENETPLPMPSNPEIQNAEIGVLESILGSQGLAEVKDVFLVNPPGTDEEIKFASGYEQGITATGLAPPMNNQVTELQPVTQTMTTTNSDLEHRRDETMSDDTGIARDKEQEKRDDISLIFVSGRAASNGDSNAKAQKPQPQQSSANKLSLVGDDTVGLNIRPRWRLHEKPTIHGPQQETSEPTEPLGRAGANCMDGCSCLRSWGYWQNGVYDISNPSTSGKTRESVPAYCDMTTDGGAWTVIQNRVDGSRNFYRKWSSYANGFGRLETDFWIGNNMLHGLTARINYQLRVDISMSRAHGKQQHHTTHAGNAFSAHASKFRDWNDEEGYAVYDYFMVGSSDEMYQLTLGKYIEGNCGDSLSYHNSSRFSTYDQDNDASSDVNCAELRQSGFWFQACNEANPNGRYIHGPDGTGLNGGVITWGTWPGHGFHYALKTFRMMIRPVNYDRILYY